MAFLVNLGQAMQAYSVPCWWVSWWLWRAGCISQDTYLLYVIDIQFRNFLGKMKSLDFFLKKIKNFGYFLVVGKLGVLICKVGCKL